LKPSIVRALFLTTLSTQFLHLLPRISWVVALYRVRLADSIALAALAAVAGHFVAQLVSTGADVIQVRRCRSDAESRADIFR